MIILFCVPLTAWHGHIPILTAKQGKLLGPIKRMTQIINSFGSDYIQVSHFNRQGLVDTIYTYDFERLASTKRHLTTEKEYEFCFNDSNWSLLSTRILKYDQAMNMISDMVFVSDTLVHSTVCEYDQNDSLVRMEEFTNYYSIERNTFIKLIEQKDSVTTTLSIKNQTDTISEVVCILNRDSKLIKRITKTFDYDDCVYTESFVYDTSGRVLIWEKTGISEWEFDECKKEFKQFVFGEEGDLITSIEVINSDFGTEQSTSFLNYNQTNELESYKQIHSRDNIILSVSENMVDRYGNFTSGKYTDYEIESHQATVRSSNFDDSYMYQYDSFGNWIQMKQYEEGELEALFKRVIEYY